MTDELINPREFTWDCRRPAPKPEEAMRIPHGWEYVLGETDATTWLIFADYLEENEHCLGRFARHVGNGLSKMDQKGVEKKLFLKYGPRETDYYTGGQPGEWMSQKNKIIWGEIPPFIIYAIRVTPGDVPDLIEHRPLDCIRFFGRLIEGWL